ncbi:MAG: PorP/SprF family type IX secretion system membrane protein [Bacteroidia bacterium]|nr:PorP/SprF family type IX secretion system membrane protein [Bacteroidia bacterium]
MTAKSQTIHFSQFFSATMLTNPANTGNFESDWRFTDLVRSQGNNFTEPYKTNLISFDKHFRIHNQQINASVYFSNDLSAQNTLMINQLYFTGGYQTSVTVKSLLLFGLQAGYVQKNSSFIGLTLPEQFDMTTGQFNSGLPSSESFTYSDTKYLDFASGVIWKFKSPGFETELGAAVFQLNKPHENFMNNAIELQQKYVVHGSFEKRFKGVIFLKPQFCYTWVNRSSELIAGGNLGYGLVQKSLKTAVVYMGAYMRTGIARNNDSAILLAGLELNNWNICFSYDYDISYLHTITSRSNAFELSVVYIRPDTFLDKKTVPCELY